MKALITATAVMAMIATQAPAEEDRNCAARPLVIQRLMGTYGETRHSIGMDARGVMVEVWANTVTGTFTVTITGPDGLMCLMMDGDGHERLAEALPPKGDEL